MEKRTGKGRGRRKGKRKEKVKEKSWEGNEKRKEKKGRETRAQISARQGSPTKDLQGYIIDLGQNMFRNLSNFIALPVPLLRQVPVEALKHSK